MIRYNEWLDDQAVNAELGGFTMTTAHDDGVLANQMEQLVNRLEGLLHDVPESKKTALIDRLMRQIEERILGL